MSETLAVFRRLMDIGLSIRVWRDEHHVSVSGIVLHYHPRWKFDLIQGAMDYAHDKEVLPFPAMAQHTHDRVFGLPVADDGRDENCITVTAEQTDTNSRYFHVYQGMPREFEWTARNE